MLSANKIIYEKIPLVAGLVPQSAHGVQIYSSCKFFLELLKRQVCLIICAHFLMAVVQQLLWSPHYPKPVVVP
jgi:hypothetical protein